MKKQLNIIIWLLVIIAMEPTSIAEWLITSLAYAILTWPQRSGDK